MIYTQILWKQGWGSHLIEQKKILGEIYLQKPQYSFGFKPLGGKVAHPVVSMSKSIFIRKVVQSYFYFWNKNEKQEES